MKSVGLGAVIAIAVGLAAFLWWRSGPAIALHPSAGVVGANRQFVLKLEGTGNGITRATVTAIQEGKRSALLDRSYSGAPKMEERITLSQAVLKDGPFTLEISAAGSAPFDLGGRTVNESHPFTYDGTPPVVAVLSTAHNIIRGGAALVVYTVSKEVEKTGVVAAGRFYPGYRQDGGVYACLFPFPYNQDPATYVPRVLAVDKAGNERLTGINFHLLLKNFSTDTITVSDTLLEKLGTEFKNRFPQAKTPVDLFLAVNRELREQNRKALAEYGRQTSPTPLWREDFLRMPNTAPLGGFAQTRTYVFQGQQVDRQTHLGFDLASVAHAPVPAANRGKVVFAGDLGIYGQCVIIDHGLGLQTLYGHLSRIGVKAGDTTEKGQAIGNTGATGMALGDHLHFGVVISGEEVNPVEWWDPAWISNNVTGKLEMAGQQKTEHPGVRQSHLVIPLKLRNSLRSSRVNG